MTCYNKIKLKYIYLILNICLIFYKFEIHRFMWFIVLVWTKSFNKGWIIRTIFYKFKSLSFMWKSYIFDWYSPYTQINFPFGIGSNNLLWITLEMNWVLTRPVGPAIIKVHGWENWNMINYKIIKNIEWMNEWELFSYFYL